MIYHFDRSKWVWGVYYQQIVLPCVYAHMGHEVAPAVTIHRLYTPWGRLEVQFD